MIYPLTFLAEFCNSRREIRAYVFSDSRIKRRESAGCKGIQPALCDAFDFVVLNTGAAWAVFRGIWPLVGRSSDKREVQKNDVRVREVHDCGFENEEVQ